MKTVFGKSWVSLVGFCFFWGFGVSSASADFIVGAPVNLKSAIPFLDPYYEDVSCLSYDGLEMYIESYRAGGYGNMDVYVLRRRTTQEPWGQPENLGSQFNYPASDGGPTISSDGLTLYIWSGRSGTYGAADLWVSTRASKDSPWQQPANMGTTINTATDDAAPWISADGLELYFTSYRDGGSGGYDLWVTTRAAANSSWSTPTNLGPTINSAHIEIGPSLSPDGLILLFQSNRPGGFGRYDLYMARRTTTKSPWGPVTNLSPVINTPDGEQVVRITPDGRTLYYTTYYNIGNTWENWQVPISPVIDFNGDGKVDAADMASLAASWGKENPLCDIGPVAWGDGVVDEKDLAVFMETATTPGPGAAGVPVDAVLSWLAPSFAKGSDVYLGTSLESVNTADRDHPRDVLVSMEQPGTTFAPKMPLEFSRTYYWRIDTVLGPANTAICKGPILSFTVESFARPIQNIVATASSSQSGSDAERTVDGSGLDKNDGHSTDAKAMWQSTKAGPHWISYEFDKVYALHELWVWNSNQAVELFLGYGAKTVKIEYSLDGATWAALAGVPEFAKAPGKAGYTAGTKVQFGGALAKYVRLTIEKGWGASGSVGLSEVRFLAMPFQARTPQPATGQTAVGLEALLNWQAGKGAVSHQVYFGTDKATVAGGAVPLIAVDKTTFHPGALDLATTYYWRIDEVNEARTPRVAQGDIWSFTTIPYLVVDGFEGYTDEESFRIYETWIDGRVNKTGSRVGYPQAPYAERMIVHDGRQSMPLQYSNVEAPFYSETRRTFDLPQNWTVGGAMEISLWLRGHPLGFLDKGGGAFTISGAGNDIWENADAFRFAYQTLTGDGSITAKVDSLVNTDPWAKAGVMIRETLEPGSVHAMMIVTPGNSCSLQWRKTADGVSDATLWSGTAVTAPYWVRLTRTGDLFQGESSPDGKTWTVLGSVTIPMESSVYIGLPVTSHSDGQVTTAQLSNVATTGAVTGTWQAIAIGAYPQPANTPDTVCLAVEDSAGKSTTVVHPDSAATNLVDWQQWRIPLGAFAGVDMTAIKKVSIGVGQREQAQAGGTGVIYIDDISFGRPLSTP